MIIWHFIPSLGIGGAERLLSDICNEMAEGNSISVFYLKPLHDLRDSFPASVEVEFVPLQFSSLLRLVKRARNEKPAIIHTHFGPSDFFGHFVALFCQAKTFVTVHSVVVKNNWKDTPIFWMYRLFYGVISRKTKFLGISQSVSAMVRNKFGVNKNRVSTLFNAVKDVPVTRNPAIPESKDFNIVFVGRLVKLKNVPVLIRAFATFHSAHQASQLTIVGDGPERAYLSQLAEKSSVAPSIKFIGKQTNPHEWVSKSDVLVCPSLTEGFGMVVIEAFRAQTAVIASEIEGLKEIVLDRQNGLLFPPQDEHALVHLLEELFQNRALKEQLAKNGRLSFEKHFELSSYIAELSRMYSLN